MEVFEEEKVPTRAGLTGDVVLDQSRLTGRGSPSLKNVVPGMRALPERGRGCKGLPGW